MSKERPTIADVATRAGVSKGAVSFALNGRPGLAQATVDRILAAADELGWRPSNRARSLSVSKAFALGLVITRDPAVLSSDPFFPAFIAGVESVLATARAGAGPAGGRRPARTRRPGTGGWPRTAGSTASSCPTSGTTIPGSTCCVELGLPAVTLNRPDAPVAVPGGLPGRPAGHDRGRRAPARARPPPDRARRRSAGPSSTRPRDRQAFVAALAAAGLEPIAIEVSDFTAAGGIEATRRLLALPEPPTAIVYANDRMAIAGLGAAQQAGLTVPDDLSIAGFDDSELAEFVHPGLTTVRADPFAFGEAAARPSTSSSTATVTSPMWNCRRPSWSSGVPPLIWRSQ